MQSTGGDRVLQCRLKPDVSRIRKPIAEGEPWRASEPKEDMSLFSWFSKGAPGGKTPRARSSGAGSEMRDSTGPLGLSDPHQSKPSAGQAEGGPAPRSARQMRREQLYGVVRDVMLKAGVLTSSYMFKVLSLDAQGRQFLVMMELSWLHNDEAYRLAEIETSIAQRAKYQCDILVSAVYWRMNECVSAGLKLGGAAPTAAPASRGTAAAQNARGFAGLSADELGAFKRSMACAAAPKPLSQPGEIIHSARRNPASETKFAHTQIGSPPSPLSGTQYGDLN